MIPWKGAKCVKCNNVLTNATVVETEEKVTYIGDGYVVCGAPVCYLMCAHEGCGARNDYIDAHDATVWTNGYVTDCRHLFDTLSACQRKHVLFTTQHGWHLQRHRERCMEDDPKVSSPSILPRVA